MISAMMLDLRRMLSSRLARVTALLFGAGMISNVSNYLFQVYAGRALGAEDYGALNALLSLLVVGGVSGGILLQVMTRYASRFVALDRPELVGALLRKTMAAVLAGGAGLLCVVTPLAPSIAGYFHLRSSVPVLLLAATIVGGFVSNAFLGVLLGTQRFGYASLSNVGGIVRVLAGALLIGAGLGVTGGVAASLVGTLAVICLSLIPLRHFLYQARPVELPSDSGIVAYSMPVLVAMTAFTSLMSVDVALARHYLPQLEAGLYAAASVLGKIALYVPSAVVTAMFPMVSAADTRGAETSSLLRRAALLTFAASSVVATGFALVPRFTLKLLLGQQFVGAAPVLRVYGCVTVPLALMNLVMNFNFARHRTSFAYWLGPIAMGQMIAVTFFHDSAFEIVAASTVAALSATGVTATALWPHEAGLSTAVAAAGAPEKG